MARTREQDREYQREYRRRKVAAAAVEAQPPAERSVEERVQAELDTLPQAAAMEASVATALAMARVLDNRTAVPQHPAAAGQLRQVMAEIRAARALPGESRLSMIRGGRAS